MVGCTITNPFTDFFSLPKSACSSLVSSREKGISAMVLRILLSS
ncbi:Uncharacterised protein [Vibrio cholerae]|nr:Uncharacterised protein [Vibrio cholerae]